MARKIYGEGGAPRTLELAEEITCELDPIENGWYDFKIASPDGNLIFGVVLFARSLEHIGTWLAEVIKLDEELNHVRGKAKRQRWLEQHARRLEKSGAQKDENGDIYVELEG